MDSKHEYGSRFLYAEDLLHGGEYKTVTVTISKVYEPGTLTAANGKKVDKAVIEFDGRQKMLVLCNSNRLMIVTATGEQFGSSWVGKQITLQPRIVNAFGEEVLAIRVIPSVGTVIRKRQKEMLGRKAIFNKEQS